MTNVNEKKIKERIVALDKDIVTIQTEIAKIDSKRLDALAQLNALHGAKQQCESMLKELHDDDQTTAAAVAGS